MSDVTLEILNKRTAVAAARAEAARIGADAEQLLDSKQLDEQLAGLDPDAPDFAGSVRAAVGDAAARLGGTPARSGVATKDATGGNGQWTLADVERSTPSECTAAMEAGLLRDLGYPPSRGRR